MYKQTVNFWVCGDLEKISLLLGAEPTGTRIKQPYDYWDYTIESDECGDSINEMISFLNDIGEKILSLNGNFEFGLTVVIESDMDTGEVFHMLEPEEMAFLSKYGIAVAFSTISLNENRSST
ncbi:hypothetical protein SAMN02745866_04340 [Alteromonadaceae bacterium Bs31]|nr:hypothetical protein SAMN02745866_04340 [Alteromonadaceae bacterium Bs31]